MDDIFFQRQVEYLNYLYNNKKYFITITEQELLDLPNDQELGEYIRRKFFNSKIDKDENDTIR